MNTLVEIEYLDSDGVEKKATILPHPGGLTFEANGLFPKPQWILHVTDVEGNGIMVGMETLIKWRQL